MVSSRFSHVLCIHQIFDKLILYMYMQCLLLLFRICCFLLYFIEVFMKIPWFLLLNKHKQHSHTRTHFRICRGAKRRAGFGKRGNGKPTEFQLSAERQISLEYTQQRHSERYRKTKTREHRVQSAWMRCLCSVCCLPRYYYMWMLSG